MRKSIIFTVILLLVVFIAQLNAETLYFFFTNSQWDSLKIKVEWSVPLQKSSNDTVVVKLPKNSDYIQIKPDLDQLLIDSTANILDYEKAKGRVAGWEVIP